MDYHDRERVIKKGGGSPQARHNASGEDRYEERCPDCNKVLTIEEQEGGYCAVCHTSAMEEKEDRER